VRTPDLAKRCKFSGDETLATEPLSALYLSRVAEGLGFNSHSRPRFTASWTVFAVKQSALDISDDVKTSPRIYFVYTHQAQNVHPDPGVCDAQCMRSPACLF
jgi:hypothetical protein